MTPRGRKVGKSRKFPESLQDQFASRSRKIRKAPLRGFRLSERRWCGAAERQEADCPVGRLSPESGTEPPRGGLTGPSRGAGVRGARSPEIPRWGEILESRKPVGEIPREETEELSDEIHP